MSRARISDKSKAILGSLERFVEPGKAVVRRIKGVERVVLKQHLYLTPEIDRLRKLPLFLHPEAGVVFAGNLTLDGYGNMTGALTNLTVAGELQIINCGFTEISDVHTSDMHLQGLDNLQKLGGINAKTLSLHDIPQLQVLTPQTVGNVEGVSVDACPLLLEVQGFQGVEVLSAGPHLRVETAPDGEVHYHVPRHGDGRIRPSIKANLLTIHVPAGVACHFDGSECEAGHVCFAADAKASALSLSELSCEELAITRNAPLSADGTPMPVNHAEPMDFDSINLLRARFTYIEGTTNLRVSTLENAHFGEAMFQGGRGLLQGDTARDVSFLNMTNGLRFRFEEAHHLNMRDSEGRFLNVDPNGRDYKLHALGEDNQITFDGSGLRH